MNCFLSLLVSCLRTVTRSRWKLSSDENIYKHICCNLLSTWEDAHFTEWPVSLRLLPAVWVLLHCHFKNYRYPAAVRFPMSWRDYFLYFWLCRSSTPHNNCVKPISQFSSFLPIASTHLHPSGLLSCNKRNRAQQIWISLTFWIYSQLLYSLSFLFPVLEAKMLLLLPPKGGFMSLCSCLLPSSNGVQQFLVKQTFPVCIMYKTLNSRLWIQRWRPLGWTTDELTVDSKTLW